MSLKFDNSLSLSLSFTISSTSQCNAQTLTNSAKLHFTESERWKKCTALTRHTEPRRTLLRANIADADAALGRIILFATVKPSEGGGGGTESTSSSNDSLPAVSRKPALRVRHTMPFAMLCPCVYVSYRLLPTQHSNARLPA